MLLSFRVIRLCRVRFCMSGEAFSADGPKLPPMKDLGKGNLQPFRPFSSVTQLPPRGKRPKQTPFNAPNYKFKPYWITYMIPSVPIPLLVEYNLFAFYTVLTFYRLQGCQMLIISFSQYRKKKYKTHALRFLWLISCKIVSIASISSKLLNSTS